MKQNGTLKTPSCENRKSKQYRQSSQRQVITFEPYQSQRLEDALQSEIAQQEILCSELKRKDETNKKQFRIADSNHFMQPSQNLISKFNSDANFQNSTLLLGESITKKISIISIDQLKRYQEKAKTKTSGYNFPEKIDFSLKVNEISSSKNDKSMKKSLSSSKFIRQKKQHFHESQKSQVDIRNQGQNDLKQNRNSLDLQSIKSFNQASLLKCPSSKNIISHNISHFLYPMTVPFSFQNINTTINNLQNLEVESNHSKSKAETPKSQQNKLVSGQNISLKKKKNRQSLLKQLNSTQYLIDVPLDMNEFSYQLDMQVNLEKNRGFQVYLISPERISDGDYFEDVTHFKYEMVKLPPNMLRLRVYLLIEKEQSIQNRKKSESLKKQQDLANQGIAQRCKRQWKVWKEIQVPIINAQKTEQYDLGKRIKVSIASMQLNSVTIKLNNMMEFNLRLPHIQVPVSYFCISQDFNGVEFTKLSLSGRQKFKSTQDLIGQGCQGKCQLI